VTDASTFGALIDPLNRRSWNGETVRRQVVHREAHYRRLGIGRSDRVFFHFGNTIEFFVDLVAIWRLGGCVIPIDARLTSFEIETIARTAGPRFSLWNGAPDSRVAEPLVRAGTTIISSPAAGEAGESVPDLSEAGNVSQPDQNALILFTSGTTGDPKGVVHSHASLQARWKALQTHLGLHAFRRTLCVLPTHFGHGLICNCLFPWLAGQDLHILPPFRADLLMMLGRLIDQHEITFISSVPAMWRLTLKTAAPPRAGSLERVFCGSAPLSASLWTNIQQWTGTKDVFNVYGITETASWLAGTSGATGVPEDGLVGEAWGGAVKILKGGDASHSPASAEECAPGEAGYVWVKTPALMKGYLDRDDLTSQVVVDGWFLTRDIGFLDDSGRLHLSRREREEINKAGMKVYPTDIDTVIEKFGQTVDVCTFAYEDALQGEDIGVAVVLDPDTAGTRTDLYEWTRQHLGKHQVPHLWYVVDEIPRTSRGKVNRAHTAQFCSGRKPSEMRVPSAAGRVLTDAAE
jgi:acyl-CoA synthetase (AMP-forming)/AMP-acid ligase II